MLANSPVVRKMEVDLFVQKSLSYIPEASAFRGLLFYCRLNSDALAFESLASDADPTIYDYR